MPTFNVVAADKKKDVPDKGYGPMQVIGLNLQDDKGEQIFAEWFTKAATQVPSPGAKLEGTIEQGQYGKTFKKQPGGYGGGGGGGRPKDPQERAAIAASVALKEGLHAVEQAATFGLLKPESVEDHAAAWKRYSEFAFKFIESKSQAAK